MTAPAHYVYTNDWKDARQRLALLEEVFDPGTIRHLEHVGVSEGWQCLEAGAGGGSIAAWLSKRVGPSGRVLATDIDTRLLDVAAAPNLEVQRHDIMTDDLRKNVFDLVHSRALLCHLPGRDCALDRMVGALKRGGWLLIEEPDYVSEHLVSGADANAGALFRKVADAKANFHKPRGFDSFYGRRVFDELRTRGMANVTAEGRTIICAGDAPMSRFCQVSFEQRAPNFSPVEK